MNSSASALDTEPRLTALSGVQRLLRVSEPVLEWAIAQAVGAPSEPLTATELQQARDVQLLDPTSDEPSLEPHWAQLFALAGTSPVRIDMVSVDGHDGWTTTVHVIADMLLVLDQVREISTDGSELSLGRRSSAVTIGVGRIQQFSLLIMDLIPQRPAFTGEPREDVPTELADPPAVAQVQMVISAQPPNGQPFVRDRSWYALGDEGELLGTLQGPRDELQLQPAPIGALTEVLKADLIAAINHVTALSTEQSETDSSQGSEIEGDEQ